MHWPADNISLDGWPCVIQLHRLWQHAEFWRLQPTLLKDLLRQKHYCMTRLDFARPLFHIQLCAIKMICGINLITSEAFQKPCHESAAKRWYKETKWKIFDCCTLFEIRSNASKTQLKWSASRGTSQFQLLKGKFKSSLPFLCPFAFFCGFQMRTIVEMRNIKMSCSRSSATPKFAIFPLFDAPPALRVIKMWLNRVKEKILLT